MGGLVSPREGREGVRGTGRRKVESKWGKTGKRRGGHFGGLALSLLLLALAFDLLLVGAMISGH